MKATVVFFSSTPIKDPRIFQELAEKSLNAFNAQSNADHKLVKIVSASRRVVSGVRYDLKLSVSDGASGAAGGQDKCLQASVIKQAWKNSEKITVRNCD